MRRSFLNGDLAFVDFLLNGAGVLAVDGASDGAASSEHFLDSSGERLREALGFQKLGNADDLVELQVSVVLSVLLLLSVTWRFLKFFEDKRRGGGKDLYCALAVLDHDFDVNLDSFPIISSFLDGFTDDLGRHTQRRTLGGECGGSGNFTTDDLHVDVGLGSWISGGLGRHCVLLPIN